MSGFDVRRLRRVATHFLIEALLIVVSVVVALTVNNWKLQHDARARAAEARQAFAGEIAANRASLGSDFVVAHHRRLQAAYAAALAAHAPDPHALEETGLHPAQFGDAAWRSFSTSTIFADFGIQEVLMLSEIYRSQAAIERQEDALFAALTVPRSDRETPAYQRDVAVSIALFLNDLVPAEEGLLARYDRALTTLRSEGAGGS